MRTASISRRAMSSSSPKTACGGVSLTVTVRQRAWSCALVDVQILRQRVQRDVPPGLRRALERERRVLVDEQPLHRVHHVEKAHAAANLSRKRSRTSEHPLDEHDAEAHQRGRAEQGAKRRISNPSSSLSVIQSRTMFTKVPSKK